MPVRNNPKPLSMKEFDGDLLRLAKSAAALKDMTLQEFLEDLIRQAVGIEPSTKKGKTK